MAGLYFEEFVEGQVFEHALTRTVTEMDNVLFTSLTMNPQPLHLDAEFARTTEFGQPLVNSIFTLGLVIGISVGDIDTVSVIDVAAKPPRVVDTISVGQTPEGLKISPDGQYVAVGVMNGSNKPKASPFFSEQGTLRIFSLNDKRLTPVTEAKVGKWCQGIVFSKDNKTILVQCMVENEIFVFDFDGKTLTPKPSIKVTGPAGIRTAEK